MQDIKQRAIPEVGSVVAYLRGVNLSTLDDVEKMLIWREFCASIGGAINVKIGENGSNKGRAYGNINIALRNVTIPGMRIGGNIQFFPPKVLDAEHGQKLIERWFSGLVVASTTSSGYAEDQEAEMKNYL